MYTWSDIIKSKQNAAGGKLQYKFQRTNFLDKEFLQINKTNIMEKWVFTEKEIKHYLTTVLLKISTFK